MGFVEVFNHLLSNYNVETEAQGDGSHRQVVKLGGGSLVSESFDFIDLTYTTLGNGAKEIGTIVYKSGGSGGTTVATLALTYDGDYLLETVTKT